MTEQRNGRFRAGNLEFSEQAGRAKSGNRDGMRLGVRFNHGGDFNIFRKKAVTLEVLDSLLCLKSFVLL